MKYAIVYSSKTGNTAQLANYIRDLYIDEECVYFGHPNYDEIKADIIFVGFWTDKGVCDESVQTFLKSLHQQKIFLFGTAGFGGSQAYFEAILNRNKAFIDESNLVVGTYMCQGKMPIAVKRRYQELAKKDPQKFNPMIENFDHALSHPDLKDFQSLSETLKSTPI